MHYKYALVCGALCLFSQYRDEAPFVFFPQVYDSERFRDVITTLGRTLPGNYGFGEHITYRPLTSGMVAHVRSVFPDADVSVNRELFDYIYDADSLISLTGKKLHQKRTHYNNFITRYNWSYTAITPDNLELLNRAYEELWRYEADEGQDFIDEHDAIAQLIGNFEALGLRAGVITVDGSIAAYSIGERFTCCHALIHTEKADKNYEGAFAAINREFAAREFSDCRFINREEDMGIEGLRRAKLSYQPEMLNEIYSLTI